MYAQKYGPPATGTADNISAMLVATNNAVACQHLDGGLANIEKRSLKTPTIIHPTLITAGPPVVRPYINRLRKSWSALLADVVWLGSLPTW